MSDDFSNWSVRDDEKAMKLVGVIGNAALMGVEKTLMCKTGP